MFERTYVYSAQNEVLKSLNKLREMYLALKSTHKSMSAYQKWQKIWQNSCFLVYSSYFKIIIAEEGRGYWGRLTWDNIQDNYRQTVPMTAFSHRPVQAISLRNPRPRKHLLEVLPFTSHIIWKNKGFICLVVLDSIFGLEIKKCSI